MNPFHLTYRTRLCLTVTLLSELASGQLGQCYFPGGALAPEQRPCDPYAYTTLCCPIGWTCFSNNVCVLTDSSLGGEEPLGSTIRGTCTNPLWSSNFCGDFCLYSGDDGSLEHCDDGNWCCASAAADGTCDCGSKKGSFSIAGGIAQTIMGVSGLRSTSTNFAIPSSTSPSRTTETGASVSTTLTLSILGTSLSSTAISTSLSQISSAGTTGTTNRPTFSTTAQSTNSTSRPTSASESTNTITKTTGFKAGISILAVVIVLCLLGTAAFLLRRRQRRRRFLTPVRQDDDSEIFHMQDAATAPQIFRPNPDPYQFHSTSSTLPRVNAGVAGNRRLDRISPPVVDPYRIPYEGT